jgi:hypothetical protein
MQPVPTGRDAAKGSNEGLAGTRRRTGHFGAPSILAHVSRMYSRPGPATTGVAHPIASLLNRGLLAWLLVLPAFLYLTPAEIWLVDFHRLPGVPVLAGVLACVLVVLWFGTYERRALCNLLVAAILGAISFCVHAQPLGDHGFWEREAANPFLGASEPLANLVYHGVFLLGGREALDLVAPAAGVVFAWLFLGLCDALFLRPGASDNGPVKKLCSLSLVAVSWHVMFARGYVENPQLSLPFLLLSVRALMRYRTSDSPRRAFLTAAAWLAVACLFHGVNHTLVPALPLLAWLFPPPGRAPLRRLGDVVWALVLWAGLIAAGIGLLLAVGFYVYQGNLHPYMLVPPFLVSGIVDMKSGSPIMLHSPEHLRFVGNILLLASPLVVALPLMLLVRGRKFALASFPHPGLLILALGYCGFTFVFYFMLGFPTDFDLILSIAVLLHLYLLQAGLGLLHDRVGRWILAGALVLSGAGSWSLHAALLVPAAEATGAHPRGGSWSGTVAGTDGAPAPMLFANGRCAELHLRPGEDLILEMRRPPGMDQPAPFAIAYEVGDPGPAASTPLPALAAAAIRCDAPVVSGLQFITNNLFPKTAQLVESGPAPWTTERPWVRKELLARLLPGATLILQGLIEDRPGHRSLTNAVIVHLP